MSFLYFLAEHRNVFFDRFFVTAGGFGEEVVALLLISYIYFCMDKKLAYNVGFAYFFSGVFANTIKVIFRVPRPWVRDPDFKPLSQVLDTATGYSFPSCHTQSAASIYGTIGAFSKRRPVKILCGALILLVGFSRMYVGVHTPADVTVGLIIGILGVFIEYKFTRSKVEAENQALFPCLTLGVMAIVSVILSLILIKVGLLDVETAADTFKIDGAAVGFCISYYLDDRFIHYDPQTAKFNQIIRLIIGAAGALIVRALLKVAFAPFGNMGHFFRYLLIVCWILVLYPILLRAGDAGDGE